MTRYVNTQTDDTGDVRKPVSLLELHLMIKESLEVTFSDAYWVRAEMSDVRVNSASKHCYLELLEKDEKNGQTVAKARTTIWARTFQAIRPYFERETKQKFASGLKVLVHVSVEFHELYGYSLNVRDIDPSYTVGDMVRRRAEIIRRLQEEGIYDLNRELPFPLLPQRIAVITSPTAAGYEDFVRQLADNEHGFSFYMKLFPAVMQGDKTEQSVITAFDTLFPYTGFFDVVVLIRGGGSTSELNSFDTYPLAASVAQFPLPVITGIGHERDDTLLDMVAHTRLKTPTAVAFFLIECMSHEAALLQKIEKTICNEASRCVLREKSVLQSLTAKLPVIVSRQLGQHRKQLQTMTAYLSALPQWIRHNIDKIDVLLPRLQRAVSAVSTRNTSLLVELSTRLQRAYKTIFLENLRMIELREQFIKMVSPDFILKRGYTLTFKNGKIVKSANDLSVNDQISIKFVDAEKKAKII